MNQDTQFKQEPYVTHTFIGDQRIIPFDTFEMSGNTYSLLKILHSTDNITFLRLIVIDGPDFGNIYVIPKSEFEQKTITEIQLSLKNYQH